MCTYRNNHDVVLQEDLVRIWSSGTVGTFSNNLKKSTFDLISNCLYPYDSAKPDFTLFNLYLSLDPGSVLARELLLSCSGDQDVAVSFQNASFVGFGSWESNNGAMLLEKIMKEKCFKMYFKDM